MKTTDWMAGLTGLLVLAAHVQAAPSDPGSRMPASSQNGTLIHSTFNPPNNNRYDCCFGWAVAGPGANLGVTQEVAMAFVPASSTTLKRVRLAISAPGPSDAVEISLRADAGGLPGAVLGSFTLTQFIVPGSCCQTEAVSAHGYPVLGGSTYWLSARALGNTSAGWQISVLPGVTNTIAFDQGSGWQVTFSQAAAFAVIGN